MDVSNEAKNAILNCLANSAWAVSDGQNYYDALADAFFGVASISAVYTQSGTVYDTDTLDSLKSDLVVTATLKDSTTQAVPSTDYALSGTLETGTSTVTVSYGGKTATFSVIVTAGITYLANWDFGNSLADKVNGYTAVITPPGTNYGTITQSTDGLEFTVGGTNGLQGNVKCAAVVISAGDVVELEITETNASFSGNAGNKGSTYGLCNGAILQIIDPDILVLGFRGQYNKFFAYYDGTWQDIYSVADPNYFSGKTVKLTVESNGNIKVYANSTLIGTLLTTSTTYSAICFGHTNSSARQTYGNMTIKSLKVYRE